MEHLRILSAPDRGRAEFVFSAYARVVRGRGGSDPEIFGEEALENKEGVKGGARG